MRPFTPLLFLAFALGCEPKDSKPPEDTGPVSMDGDGDGYVSVDDCDDANPAIHPGADERCDGVDNDCDGEIDEDDAVDMLDWYLDADGDGWGDQAGLTEACEIPSAHVERAGDCDDDDPEIHPGAAERCNGLDDDCDGAVDEDPTEVWYADADGDGYGDADNSLEDCDPGPGWVADDSDCDDTSDSVFPGADELCNDLDDDCDGEIDEDLAETWYADADGDGFGDPDTTTEHCGPGVGWVQDSADCDDGDASIHPDAAEYCDERDNDCDGLMDDDDPDIADQLDWYLDADADGYGLDTSVTQACEQPSGYTALAGDCDDADAAYNPGASETDCTDSNDYNCDGSTGYADLDGDGWAACAECDDLDAAVYPGADESCNGADDDCDGTVDEDDAVDAATWYADADGDGYGDSASTTVACSAPSGFVGDDSDCDDGTAAVNPGATELCNGVDDDCDGTVDEDDAVDAATWYVDADGDGYGDVGSTTAACSQPSGHVSDHTDCDDAAAEVFPGATELCNLVDDDCDGIVDEDEAADAPTWYADADVDGYGDPDTTTQSCSQPSGYTPNDTDCDDGDALVNPGATELCNGVDDDCDGSLDEDDAADSATWYADSDGDGFGDGGSTAAACAQPSGYVADFTDCDDDDALVNPDATELCNGEDDDCDGTVDEDDAADAATWYADADVDGYGDAGDTTAACGQPSGYVADDSDCDDGDAMVSPDATELCDAIDNDCDGTVDEDDAADASTWYADFDGDGYGDLGSTTTACSQPSGHVSDDTDCDDGDAMVNPAATELCNGIDDDCDGTVDEDDAADASTWYADGDGDGHGDASSATVACDQPSGHVSDDTDCDDGAAAVNPGATETCNSVDDDCDGTVDEDEASDAATWYADADGDGYGDAGSTTVACSQPSGHVADDADCDDGDADVHPYATEYCDGVDEDCDGTVDEGAADAPTWYLDADLDGYGDASSSTRDCEEPSGYTDVDTDCDDTDADINPGASETCDGVDEDCDGVADDGLATTTWYYDDDGDGYGDPSDSEDACSAPSGAVATGGDCDDLDAGVNPGASEACNGIDDDCDGDVDEGFTSDCDSLACSGSGLVHTVPDGCMDDGGGSSGGDSLYVFCIDGIARFCLSGESCKFNPTPSSDDGTTCDRSGLGSDYMANGWCTLWNGHGNYYCDSSGQIYFP